VGEKLEDGGGGSLEWIGFGDSAINQDSEPDSERDERK
jgi:hypothetical protein